MDKDPILPEMPPDAAQGATEFDALVEANLGKARRIRDAGINPYPYTFTASHSIEALRADFNNLAEAGAHVSVASRATALRSAGKQLMFLDLAPTASELRRGNKIQVLVRRDQLDGPSLTVVENISIGDWVAVEGTCMVTRSGELTLRASNIIMLSKVLRTVPFPKIQSRSDGGAEHYRIQNQDVLWRYPELDMLTGRKAEVLALRSRVLRRLRDVLTDKFGCIEVETPYLNSSFGGAEARPFTTEIAAFNQQVFLAISPEVELKRMIVGGLGSGGVLGKGVFYIARNFRNEGVDRTHNPEFTALEVYVPFVDYTSMMEITETLFREACIAVHGSTRCTYKGRELNFGEPWPRLPMVELVTSYSGIDVGVLLADEIRTRILERGIEEGGAIPRALARPAQPASRDELHAILQRAGMASHYPDVLEASAAELRMIAERHRLLVGIDVDQDWDHLVLELFDTFCEQFLWAPCHVTLHPAGSTVLCKQSRGGPLPNGHALIERFESFGAGMELSNAYSELNDPVLQRALVEQQAHLRAAGKVDAMPHNERFLRSIEMGLPPCGGLGIGIDRMIMLLLDCQSIREVIAFPMTSDLTSAGL